MALTVRSTTIKDLKGACVVEMVLADRSDLEIAENVVRFRASLDSTVLSRRVPMLQIAALGHVRDTISEEIQRLQSLEAGKA